MWPGCISSSNASVITVLFLSDDQTVSFNLQEYTNCLDNPVFAGKFIFDNL